MKKSLHLTAFLSILSTSFFESIGGIEDSVNDVSNTVQTILSIILEVVFSFNVGYFFGLNADHNKVIVTQTGDTLRSLIGSLSYSVVFSNNTRKMKFAPIDSSEYSA